MILADIDTGTPIALFIIGVAGLVAAVCLICGLVMLFLKRPKAFAGWVAAAGIIVVLGILLAFLSVRLAKGYGLL